MVTEYVNEDALKDETYLFIIKKAEDEFTLMADINYKDSLKMLHVLIEHILNSWVPTSGYGVYRNIENIVYLTLKNNEAKPSEKADEIMTILRGILNKMQNENEGEDDVSTAD